MSQKDLSVSPHLSGFLDFVRWLAALLVVLGHIRGLWCAEYANLQNKTFLIKALYFLTGFGPEAVMVFFVLSGYLVGGGALLRWRAGKFRARDYFISRFSRIYTVLLPALVFGGILDWLGLRYFNATEIYTNSPSLHTLLLDFYINKNLGIATFLGNVANLQSILTSHFGSNSPLWSLAWEWWYYCLFGLMLELVVRRSSGLLFWIFASAVLFAFAVLPALLLLYMVIWGVGALAANLDFKRFIISPYAAAALFIFMLIGTRLLRILWDSYMTTLPSSMYTRFWPNLLLAASFSLLIISLRNRPYPILRHLAFHKHMADFSYTIYLMHVPLLVFITAILSSHFGVPFFIPPGPQVLLIMIAILLVIYILLYLFSRIAERFTPNVKALLSGIIPGQLKTGG